MSTIKVFRENVYENQLTAQVVDRHNDKEGNTVLTLDKTIFFPGGGGQSCDLGTIENFPILSVYEREDIIYHQVAGDFPPIDTVHCVLDWDRRFDNMQRHCGEHILSGMFYREFRGVNRGFHMGQDYMTIDISLEPPSQFKTLTWEMAIQAQDLTNQAIWANLPVQTRLFPQGKEAEGLPLRKSLNIEDNVFIVSVGSMDNASDCVACCGTHPSTSGQVGLVKIYKVEKNKDMFRIYFDAGARAMANYEASHHIITSLGKLYSGGKEDLLTKINAQEDRTKDMRNRFTTLKKSVTSQRISEITDQINQDLSQGLKQFYIYEYKDLSVDDALPIGRGVSNLVKKLLVLVMSEDNTLLLFSDGKATDCGKLVKDNASIYRGKGGGSKDSARAIFPDKDGMTTFIDLLEKHLR